MANENRRRQKNIGIVMKMTREGKDVESIMNKTGFNESQVRYWQEEGRKQGRL